MLKRRMTAPSETGSQRSTPAPLELWFAYPADLVDAAVEEECAALLSHAERDRAACFQFDRHRRQYLATHALARTALSHAHALPPRQWSYTVNAYGKPAPIPNFGIGFNQSHCEELVACLIAHFAPTQPRAMLEANPKLNSNAGPEVGIDVEPLSRGEEIVSLAPSVFSAAEQAQLNAQPPAERPHRALSLWTLKEAYIKARGMGLSLPLQGISFLFGGAEGIHLETSAEVDSNPARWRFCLLDHTLHRIAMVVDSEILDPKNPDPKIPGQKIPHRRIPRANTPPP